MFTKKYTSKDIYLLNKYLNKFKKEVNNNSIDYIFKTKNYTITIYKNKTLLIQGKMYENILKMIDSQYEHVSVNNNIKISKNIIGSDEVGTGDTFGGIIVCACYINEKDLNLIKTFGITDSKKLDNKSIIELFNKIQNIIEYEVINLSPKEYNDLYQKYKDLNIIKTFGHYYATRNLINRLKFNDFTCIIDQFTPINKYKDYLKQINESPNGKEITEVKAESKYIQVATASIVARYFFIKQLNALSQKAKFNIPFGSSTNLIRTTIKKINENKLSIYEFAKTHFKEIKNNT